MRALLTLLSVAAIGWALALDWFVAAMPDAPLPISQKAQAIVVLTGGAERVEHGLNMLAQEAAPVLFVSGVGEHVTIRQLLLEHASPTTRTAIENAGAKIVLDRVSRSTISNAGQTAAFLRARNINSIRLVTANYHMQRSIREFKTAMPGLTIWPDPVFPEGFRRNEWWKHANTRRLVFSEFYKYFAVLARNAARPADEKPEE